MSARRNRAPNPLRRPALMVALLLALPLAAAAQTAPAAAASSASTDMAGVDMGAMPRMPMPAASATRAAPARKKLRRKPAPPLSKDMQRMQHDGMAMPMPARAPAAARASGRMSGMDRDAMPTAARFPSKSHDMQGRGDMSDMDHASMPRMDHGVAKAPADAGMAGMSMGPMQGGNAAADARSPDYSDGLGYGGMHGMDMADDVPLGMLLIDQLEAFDGRDASGQSWQVQGWYGTDANKLWLRSEGGRSGGRVQDADMEALWSHAAAAYWDTQLGVRRDFGSGPARNWLAFGVQGLAPYWFGLQATGYVGASGRTAARVRVDYDLRFTQRLILQPEAEANLYGKDDPRRRLGRGLSDVQFGLRLRYEIRRRFAPYLGVNWLRRIGTTAGYARQDRQPVLDRQLVAGVRLWF